MVLGLVTESHPSLPIVTVAVSMDAKLELPALFAVLIPPLLCGLVDVRGPLLGSPVL